MDNTAPTDTNAMASKQNIQPLNQVQPTVQINAQQQAVQQQPQSAPAQPISTAATKEGISIAIPKPEEEFIQETAPEAKIAEELEKAGVEATKGEVLEVSPDVAQAGVVSSGAATPVPQEPSLNFPMTEEKAKGILKMHKKIKDSVTWLAMLVARQFQMIQSKNRVKK